MPSRSLPGLSLSGFWTLGEDDWKDGMDANLLKLSALAQPVVLSRTTVLPGISAASEGDIYIVPFDAASNADQVAVFDNGNWVYFVPEAGWTAYVVDDAENVQYSGSAWEQFAAAGGGSSSGTPSVDQFVQLSIFASGVLDNSETIFSYIPARDFQLPAGLTSSYFVSSVAATSETILSIKKNGTEIGTITFAASGTSGTLAMASATSFTAGTDLLTVVGPLAADSTLADVTGTLFGDII